MTEPNLKIAIVHDFLFKIGGAEKVLLSLHKIFPEAPIYTLVYDKNGTKNIFESSEFTIHTSGLQKQFNLLGKKPRLLLGKYPQAIEEFDFSEYDIVISSSNSFAHGIITSAKTFHLCYCHSPMRYCWDWHFEYLKENNILLNFKGLYIRYLIHKIRIWDKLAAERVDAWVANSTNVQKRIKKYYRKDSTIINPPVPISQINSSESIPDDYYVIVSRLEPYKQIDIAIKAMNENQKNLIIIGEGKDNDRLKKIANKNIEFLGWQSDQSVYEYIRNSKALIFPGEDDFGITPIEAMACGRPVIAYNKGGAKESVENDKTGIFFDEPTPEALNDAIKKLETNYLRFSPTTCIEKAKEFSEENFCNSFKQKLEKLYINYQQDLKI